MTVESSINLNLPENPQGGLEENQDEFRRIYAALRLLQAGVAEQTGDAFKSLNGISALVGQVNKTIQSQNLLADYVKASEAISASKYVNLHYAAGERKIRNAIASSMGTKAHGWVPAAIASGDFGIVYYFLGLNQGFGGLTPGDTYYLSSSSPGGITTVAPVAIGTIKQELGFALTDSSILTNICAAIQN